MSVSNAKGVYYISLILICALVHILTSLKLEWVLKLMDKKALRLSLLGSFPLLFLIIYKIIVYLLMEGVLNSVIYSCRGVLYYLSVVMHRKSYFQVWHQIYYFIIIAFMKDFMSKVFWRHILTGTVV